VRASRAVIAAQRHQFEVLSGTKKQRAADLEGAESVQVWAGNFRRATRAVRNPKTEVMQFDDRGDHAQPQTQAFGVSTFV